MMHGQKNIKQIMLLPCCLFDHFMIQFNSGYTLSTRFPLNILLYKSRIHILRFLRSTRISIIARDGILFFFSRVFYFTE